MAVLFLISGCNDGLNECFSGPGKITTKRIGLYEFRNVKVNDNIELVLNNGTHYSLEVTGGEYVLPMLDVAIVNNTLHLANNSTCPMFKKPWDNITVLLTVPQLDTLTIMSYGGVKSKEVFKSENLLIVYKESPANVAIEINCESLWLQYLSGTGDITIRGNAERGYAFHTGYGVMDFTELSTQFLNLNLRSANHSYVRGAETYFFVVTGGTGNVYYTNTPGVIDWFKEGDGDLIRLNQ